MYSIWDRDSLQKKQRKKKISKWDRTLKANGRSEIKLNNIGFTLVEVIVAAAIMALVSVPLLHALTTAVNTNARAKEKMRATNAAENIMEDLKSMNVSEAVEKYSNGAITVPNKPGKSINANPAENVAYEIEVSAAVPGLDKDLKDAINKGYEAVIRIDPSTYVNSNTVNLGSFNSVSSDTAAVYNMSPLLDDRACDEFSERNNSYRTLDSTIPPKTSAEIDKLLKREIRIDIDKKGTFVDEDGNTCDKVNVFLTVSYLLTSNDNNPEFVQKNNRVYIADSRMLFDNTMSETPFSAVFVMYYPRTATENGDIIIIHNHDDVETDLYIAAQTPIDENYLKRKKDSLILQIYEDTIADVENGGEKEPITLYTNLLLKDADYAKVADSEQIPVQARIHIGKSATDPEGEDTEFDDTTYNTLVNKRATKFEDKDTAKALNAKNLAGKTLDASTVKNRIYDLSVSVYKGYEKDADDNLVEGDKWPVKVELTGTILE